MSIYAKTPMEAMPGSCNECAFGRRYGCVGDVECRILREYFTGNVKPPYKERPDICPLREIDDPVEPPAIKWLSWENAEEWGTIYCPMLDAEVMTYCPKGAPAFDTYTAPFIDADGEAGYYKYDQDEGAWDEDLLCISDYTEGMKLRL